MNNQISKLINILSSTFEINFDNNKVYELSVYTSIKYAIITHEHSLSDKTSLISFYNSLSRKYPKLINIYEELEKEINNANSDIKHNLLSLINNDQKENALVISDIYQHIKSFLLSSLISQKTDIIKKTGRELLFQTQFFTDSYMVDYLLDRIFETYSDVDNILFVDPASGGGNFLALIYLRLYDWYQKKGFAKEDISRTIFNRNILGYDLDAELSEIACLSLFMLAYNKDNFDSIDYIYNFGGQENDYKGYLNDKVCSNLINGKDFETIINIAKSDGRHIVYVTNPPFMGKRDMDSNLKSYLQAQLPIAKGDMCFSFMLRIMSNLRKDDALAIVAQNGWMNLSSLKEFRQFILTHFCLLNCIDLGSNAFKNINGEKTNVVLAIFTNKESSYAEPLSSFGNLRSLSLSEKISSLKLGNYPVYYISTDDFKRNNKYEFNYQLSDDLQLFANYAKYGEFAKCMQGSSTGDNQSMVKYIWEIDSPEWKLASKGGGFCKWEGLNFYKVKWGEQGELIKNQKGGVLRNPKEIPSTQLVFSDTGTLGLNIRIKMEDQVFIASGPGIKVLKGDVYCHLAFLNSKLATYLMKIINPKFTISGGYIQKLPVAKGVLDNDEISSLSMLCLGLKYEYLSNKLPNAEFKHIDYSAITNVQSFIEKTIRSDIQNMYERIVAERLIDSLILSEYNLSNRLKQDYRDCMTGYEEHDNVSNSIDINMIDKHLSRMLSASCTLLGKKVEGKLFGSENFLEILSYQTKSSYNRLIECIFIHISEMNETIEIYKNDLIHKMILHLYGVDDLIHVKAANVNIKDLKELLFHQYPSICRQLGINEEKLKEILIDIHIKVFFNKPILTIK